MQGGPAKGRASKVAVSYLSCEFCPATLTGTQLEFYCAVHLSFYSLCLKSILKKGNIPFSFSPQRFHTLQLLEVGI